MCQKWKNYDFMTHENSFKFRNIKNDFKMMYFMQIEFYLSIPCNLIRIPPDSLTDSSIIVAFEFPESSLRSFCLDIALATTQEFSETK